MDGFTIKEGITDDQIGQLVEFTRGDESVIKFTSDSKRFTDIESAKTWLNNPNLQVFSLIDKDDLLAGIGWLDNSPIPHTNFTEPIDTENYSVTSAIRIYGKYRGKGLATDFYKQVLSKVTEGMWESISINNTASIKLHEKFGFRQVSNPDSRGKIIMVKDPQPAVA